MVIFVLVTVILSILLILALHDVANRAKQDVIEQLDDSEGPSEFVNTYPVDEGEQSLAYGERAAWIGERVSDMRTWALEWPSLRRSLKLLLIGILFLVFYRAMLIWIGLFVYAVVSGRAERKAGSKQSPRQARASSGMFQVLLKL